MPFAKPETLHPVLLPDGFAHKGTVLLKASIDHQRIEVGDFSYASSFNPTEKLGGNPRRMRFDDDTIKALNDIAWWNWEIEQIAKHEEAIVGADLAKLQDARTKGGK